MIIFTHCYSNSVINYLIQEKKAGKKFQVYNTETRPKFLGRITAKKLAKAGIKVTHMTDLAGTIAIKNSDLFLFGIEKITKEGNIINKVGTLNFIEIAKKHKIPCYAITSDNKTSKKRIQKEKQVWNNPPKGIKIFNPGHEEIPKKLIDKIITLPSKP